MIWLCTIKSDDSLQQYLHESRHEHAVKRVRGPGGRFLTAVEKEAAGTGGTSNEASYDQRK